jgi:phage minor structural protein
MTKAILYNANEERFDTYGLGFIETLARNVERERNGIPKLYMELDAFNPMNAILKEGMKIKADAGKRTKNQTFVIERVVKNSNGITQVYANHIVHNLTKTALKPDIRVSSTLLTVALEMWRTSLIGDTDWTLGTDIQAQGPVKWIIDKHTNAFSALIGVEGSIIDVFGGEFEFDNRRIVLHKQLGRDTPTVLEYGRNIITAEQDAELTNVYTSVYPYAITTGQSHQGKDGEYIQGDAVIHTIKGYVIDGPHRDKYANQRILPVNFSDKFDDKKPPNEADLRKLAEKYIKDNQIGVPNVNIKVEYADLASTLDYASNDVASVLEEVELCDIVPVYFGALGIETKAKVIKTVYDFELEEYTSVEIGHSTLGVRSAIESVMGGQIKDLEAKQKTIASDLGAFIMTQTGNRIWYEKPGDNVEHKIGDVWFEKNGLYKRMKIWNGSDWELQFDTEDLETVRTELAKANEQAEALKAQVAKFKVPEGMTLEQMADYITKLNEQQRTTIKAIGNDANMIYTLNRIQEEVVTRNPVTISVEAGKLVLRHNGSGFTAGEEYNLSFTMEEVERPHKPEGVRIKNGNGKAFSVVMKPTNESYLTKAGDGAEGQEVSFSKVYYDDYYATMRVAGHLPLVVKITIDDNQQDVYTMTLIESADYLESLIDGHINQITVACDDTYVYIANTNITEEVEQTL